MMMTSMLNDGDDDDLEMHSINQCMSLTCPTVHYDYKNNDGCEEEAETLLFLQVGWVLVYVCHLPACWLLFAMWSTQYNGCVTFYTGVGLGLLVCKQDRGEIGPLRAGRLAC